MQGGAGRSGGATSAPGRATSALTSSASTSAEEQRRRLDQLQAAVRDLEADNKRLREGLSSRPVTGSGPTSNGALFRLFSA